jgi:hypothetical protein
LYTQSVDYLTPTHKDHQLCHPTYVICFSIICHFVFCCCLIRVSKLCDKSISDLLKSKTNYFHDIIIICMKQEEEYLALPPHPPLLISSWEFSSNSIYGCLAKSYIENELGHRWRFLQLSAHPSEINEFAQ